MNTTGHAQGHVHTIGLNGHQHTWNDGDWTMQGSTTIVPSAGMIGGITDYSTMTLNRNYINADMQVNAERIMFQNKNLTKAVEDMAILLKMIVEKYDLHEVRKLVEETEVATWAHDAKYREDLVEEKKEHLDEKLFEI